MAEEYVTNPSATEEATKQKYQNPSNLFSEELVSEDGSIGTIRRNLETGDLYDASGLYDETGRLNGLPAGAEPEVPSAPEVNFTNAQGEAFQEDLRVKIRVPNSYITRLTSGGNNQLSSLQAIIFPYTPTISFESKAEYSEQKPLHNNFTVNFYQRSSVSGISISGKFTVENTIDAETYISTTHLLKALTKMRFGLDSDAGAPPPVCRLDAYGDMFLVNVPVAITSFRIEYTDDVDYFFCKKWNTSVPVRSTVQVTLLPMYSRNEMLRFSVNEYLKNSGESYRKIGYI